MALTKPMVFRAPILITAFNDSGYIEGCTNNTGTIKGDDHPPPPDDGWSTVATGILTVGAAVGAVIVTAKLAIPS
jgi:hypothetical protein